jgi:hypothetical protein
MSSNSILILAMLGLLLFIGGQGLLRRGRGGKMSQQGLISCLVGLILLACVTLVILDKLGIFNE